MRFEASQDAQFMRPYLENTTITKKRKKKTHSITGGKAQGVGPEFNPQYHPKKPQNSQTRAG
jgi:hypothetical protein